MKKLTFSIFFLIFSFALSQENEIGKIVEDFKKNTNNKELKEQAKKSVDEFYKKQPYVEEWKKRIDYDKKTGKLIIKGDVDIPNKDIKIGIEKNRYLSQTDRIYIFVSSSVPKETLIEYAKSIDELGLNNRAVMVIRGCIGGCKYIKPTLKWISSILHENGKNKDGIPIQFWIDPLLFRMYKINKVPCIAFAEDVRTVQIGLSEGLKYNLKTKPKFALSCGDWSLVYHLRQLYKKTKNPKLKTLLKAIKKTSFKTF